ncbi:hypothetical protein AX14_005003 [Amanita brunnescens Koide BX004]|nr:hypothetical protein AX14_005003 [Amanita brunnescens Koide BX004]
MAVGAKEMDLDLPLKEFLRWMYENDVAAPHQIGNKVEVKSNHMAIARGIIWDICFKKVSLCDTVKVVKSSMINRQGWVIRVQDDRIEVFDRDRKEQFAVKSWQLVPHEDFEMRQERRFDVGEAVYVINPLSAEYGKNGRVSSVSESVIEVINSRTKTAFMVPPWFLQVDTALDPMVQAPSAITNLAGLRDDDEYKKLVGTEENGPNLWDYHLGLHKIPAAGAYPIPCFQRQPIQPERAATPLPEEADVAENQTEDQRLSSPSAGVDGLPDAAEVSTQTAETTPMISYGDEHKSCVISLYRSDISLTGLPVNWMLRHELAMKCIYAYIRNSKPDFMEGGGVGKGQYDGQRVLILSGVQEDKIEVHIKDRTLKLPARFLFPQRPTARGQDVVVISGDRAREVFIMWKPKPDGSFPLGRPGFLGLPSCTMEPSRLASLASSLTRSSLLLFTTISNQSPLLEHLPSPRLSRPHLRIYPFSRKSVYFTNFPITAISISHLAMAEIHIAVVVHDTVIEINPMAFVNPAGGVYFFAVVNFAAIVNVGGVYGAIDAADRIEDIEMHDVEGFEAGDIEDIEMGEANEHNMREVEEDVEMGVGDEETMRR